jgi:uncharacterized protein (TIGR02145 family)
LTSDIAEVAVGCGAKTVDGDWLSFMCFNVGASYTTLAQQLVTESVTAGAGNAITLGTNEQAMWGSLFQWGRVADGHEKRLLTNYVASTGLTSANIDAVGAACTSNQPWNQIGKTTGATWFGKFIAGGSISNWVPSDVDQSTITDILWRSGRYAQNDICAHIQPDGTLTADWYDGVTTTSCPVTATNWRMPAQDDWGSIYRNGTLSGASTSATANTWFWHVDSGNGNVGYEIRPDAVTTTLFLPASGYRNSSNGNFTYRSSSGYYWSITTASGTNAYSLYFYNNYVLPVSNNLRAGGFSVRCIANN